LLTKLGRDDEAWAAFDAALRLVRTDAERPPATPPRSAGGS
jgi:predicted RNA polymerase sigma factor